MSPICVEKLTCAPPFRRFFFPDSPATARFLTPEERIIAVERIKVNQAGVENKRFKREQYAFAFVEPKLLCAYCLILGRFLECLSDPKSSKDGLTTTRPELSRP